MFDFFRRDPEPPLGAEEREFVDRTFAWLAEQFTWAPVRKPIVTPTKEFFRDEWTASDEELDDLFSRVCRMMQVEEERVALSVFAEDDDPFDSLLLTGEKHHSGPAGLYYDEKHEGRFVLAVSERALNAPGPLVATLAHELGHVHLLGDKRLSPENPEHEKVTDLLTIFFGLGIFTANSAFQFSQWQYGQLQGWSASRLGYLDEPMLGYALAIYALVRGERKPGWASHLEHGVLTYMKRAERFLSVSPPRALRPSSGGVSDSA